MISDTLRNPLALFDVRDKVAVITGASGTFGRACALALTSLGGKVVDRRRLGQGARGNRRRSA